ncbi:MAG: ABC transporter ATP-binding protein [Gemmatimonadota bacterium]
MPGTARLSLDKLTRRFEDKLAVDSLSLEIASGELVALMGASGSGKTTTLRMVAGYEPPDSGKVWLEGKDITTRAPRVRGFGMVFQHYALFPHMTVGQNVAFGLEARGVSKTERGARAATALANVGLSGASPRAIQSLSGGEQQRVALARALVIEPPVLLLDEPLSNLDPNLRRSTRNELRATLRRLGLTALFVTHDQEDAFAVADRVALMENGRLLQVGAPEELHDNPVSRSVAEFIGRATFVPGEFDGAKVTVHVAGSATTFAAHASASLSGVRDVLAVLRPDALAFVKSGTGWQGVVTDRRFAGTQLVYRVRVDDHTEVELQSTDRDVREGDKVSVRVVREPVSVVAV